MSRKNVEVIERVLAAGNSGDFETILALHHPDWEGVIAQEYPVAGTVTKHVVYFDRDRALAELGLALGGG